ncbi:MAG: hypothetical protein HC822_19835 [Oscillochloris sp.]|nr:hypothetical protein [Oscillochloris sp.]
MLQRTPGGAPGQTAFVGLRTDSDNSRETLAQSDDSGFFVGEDGAVFSRAGNGAGGFDAPGPDGIQAQVATNTAGWSAELRIERTVLGGWDHLLGLSAGHYGLTEAPDGFAWPYAAEVANPASWAETALGIQPLISALDPHSAELNSAGVTLTIQGSGFVAGSEVRWNNTPLATSFVDAEQLTAEVGAELLSGAVIAQITVHSPEPGDFASNPAPFLVQAAAPVITGLSPDSTYAGRSTLNLTISGANFAPGAQVLWDGLPLPTERINNGELRAQVATALLGEGRQAGVSVRNVVPDEQISAVFAFNIEARAFQLSLPILMLPPKN